MYNKSLQRWKRSTRQSLVEMKSNYRSHSRACSLQSLTQFEGQCLSSHSHSYYFQRTSHYHTHTPAHIGYRLLFFKQYHNNLYKTALCHSHCGCPITTSSYQLFHTTGVHHTTNTGTRQASSKSTSGKPSGGDDSTSVRNKYRHSINLPTTTFNLHSNPLERESYYLHRITTKLYEWQNQQHEQSRSKNDHHNCQPYSHTFLLHDGPPFANGRLHIGHFLNKTLKDIINRYKLLRGYHIRYIPGWDCHGLPIELKALESLRNKHQNQNNNYNDRHVARATSDSASNDNVNVNGHQHPSAANDNRASPSCSSSSSSPPVASLSPMEVRSLCYNFASDTIEQQRQQFQGWGVMGDWQRPYQTMSSTYETQQLHVFRKMYDAGLIYRSLKPVYWSPVSCTALAEAELEYVDNHLSPAVYVEFPIQQYGRLDEIGINPQNEKYRNHLSMLIWSTTPWTLPSNVAIAYSKELRYAVVRVGDCLTAANHNTEKQNKTSTSKASSSRPVADDQIPFETIAQQLSFTHMSHQYLIVGVDRIGALQQALKRDLHVEQTFHGSSLHDVVCQHPFIQQQSSRLLAGRHVTNDVGTSLVHTAPAHGVDDWQLCVKEHNMDISNIPLLIDEHGKFNDRTPIAELRDQYIFTSANKRIIDLLIKSNALLHLEKYLHRYPYDWRSKTPVMVRATNQWFCRLDSLGQDALHALEHVNTVPGKGKHRFIQTLGTRNEWCISRQRYWGMPIPAFYRRNVDTASNTADDNVLMNTRIIEHFQSLVKQHGSNCWWTMSESELLPPDMGIDPSEYRKGNDTLDVWFDSGTSWMWLQSMLSKHYTSDHEIEQQRIDIGESVVQADVYLEGSDQYRGWFQSSLLTSVACNNQAPYKNIVTHGFVLDEQQRKMSKSLGNVIDPADVINGDNSQRTKQSMQHTDKDQKQRRKMKSATPSKSSSSPFKKALGVDVLRLWVASSDYTDDVSIGVTNVQKVEEAFKRIRTILKFLVGNLNDFHPHEHAVSYDDMYLLDKYMLDRLYHWQRAFTGCYDEYNFRAVYSQLMEIIATDLSALYFDICKDRVYVDGVDSQSRRSVQTVLFYVHDFILKTLAPIIPFTTEEVYDHISSALQDAMISSHTNTNTGDDSMRRLHDDSYNSIFTRQWYQDSPSHIRVSESAVATMDIVKQVRSRVNKCIEVGKNDFKIAVGSNVDVDVVLYVDQSSELYGLLGTLGEELNTMLLTSHTDIHPLSEFREMNNETYSSSRSTIHMPTNDIGIELGVTIGKASGEKCPRCWKYSYSQHEDHLCQRCQGVVQLFH